MPFRSKAQVRELFAENPTLAKEWLAKYGMPKNLPEHVKPAKRHRKRRKPRPN
jgi:ribosomal 50S subunit-associated protein YjgA (DUF615 family)